MAEANSNSRPNQADTGPGEIDQQGWVRMETQISSLVEEAKQLSKYVKEAKVEFDVFTVEFGLKRRVIGKKYVKEHLENSILFLDRAQRATEGTSTTHADLVTEIERMTKELEALRSRIYD